MLGLPAVTSVLRLVLAVLSCAVVGDGVSPVTAGLLGSNDRQVYNELLMLKARLLWPTGAPEGKSQIFVVQGTRSVSKLAFASSNLLAQ